jgi:hypothetical protein
MLGAAAMLQLQMPAELLDSVMLEAQFGMGFSSCCTMHLTISCC